MPVIRLNAKNKTITLRKSTNAITLKQTGRRGLTGATGPQGPKGDQGDPATNLVQSVNGKQGVVVLNASDVNADPAGSASQALSDAKDYTDTEVSTLDSSLAAVAKTGSYNDLTNKPTIPSIAGLATEAQVPPPGVLQLGINVGTIGVDSGDLSDFLTATGQDGIASWASFVPDNGNFEAMLEEYEDIVSVVGDTIMEISWSFPGSTNLAGIANGNDDEYIEARAEEVATHGKPTFIRLNWEANGNWYTYSPEDDEGNVRPGNSPSDYVDAWRRTYTIFKRIAPNASFVWCPHTWNIIMDGGEPKYPWESWYPGDEYVDWIATNMYLSSAIWDWIQNGEWGLQDIADFALAHNKPMRICEWGAGQSMAGEPADNEAQMEQFRDWLLANPVVRAIIYFQMSGWSNGVNYRIANYPLVLDVYKSAFVGDSKKTTQRPYTAMAMVNSLGAEDASSSSKGIVQLTGDLGGTASAPTTPTAVHKTGAETISGVKTLKSNPIIEGQYAQVDVKNESTDQYSSASARLINTASTMAGAAGVQIASVIADSGATSTNLNIDILDKDSSWLGNLAELNLSTKETKLKGQLDLQTHKIVNVVDPTSAQEVATKSYVDSLTGYDEVQVPLTVTGLTGQSFTARKYNDGRVLLYGTIANTTGSNIVTGTTIATMPSGYIPSSAVRANTAVWTNGSVNGVVSIAAQSHGTPGSVQVYFGFNTTQTLSFNGITYIV